MQQCDAFQHWLCERSAVEAQMDDLLAAGLPTSSEERLTRQIQFMSLVERRDAAARDLLQRLPSLRRRKSPCTQSDSLDQVTTDASTPPNSSGLSPLAGLDQESQRASGAQGD